MNFPLKKERLMNLVNEVHLLK